MKKIFFTLFLLFFLTIPVFAQETEMDLLNEEVEIKNQVTDIENSTVTSTNQYFKLELKRGVQSPITKKIPFTVYITPKMDSPKTQITWNIPTSFKLEQKHEEYVSLKKDQTYSFSASAKPEQKGTYDITVNVISWQYNTNKSNSAYYNITLDKSLVIQPLDPKYTLLLLLFVFGVLVASGALIFVLIKSLKIIIKKVKVWITPPV